MQVLGNYEFDNNIEGFLLFFQNVNFIIFSLNINLDLDFRIKLYVKKSYVIEVGGEKIGVIGYIIKDMFMIFQLGKQYLKGVGWCFFFYLFQKIDLYCFLLFKGLYVQWVFIRQLEYV